MKYGPLTYVEWEDSSSLSGPWHRHAEIESLTLDICRSVGWLVNETRRSITLVAHCSSHACGGEIVIPKTCILKRWSVKQPPKRRRRLDK